MINLISNLNNVRNEVLAIYEARKDQFDEFDYNAIKFIINYIEELLVECKSGNLKSKNKRHSHLSRLLIDRDDSLINYDLGVRLINIEKEYICY